MPLDNVRVHGQLILQKSPSQTKEEVYFKQNFLLDKSRLNTLWA